MDLLASHLADSYQPLLIIRFYNSVYASSFDGLLGIIYLILLENKMEESVIRCVCVCEGERERE